MQLNHKLFAIETANRQTSTYNECERFKRYHINELAFLVCKDKLYSYDLIAVLLVL
jgi:hypothetical protein